jgi:hypothetical protein
MQFINTKILLAILASLSIIAGLMIKQDIQISDDRAKIELQREKSETRQPKKTINFNPDKYESITADDLFN